MSGLVGAVRFLTRVPVPFGGTDDHRRVVPWFPAAGALIGLVVGGVAALASAVVAPTVAGALGVVAGLLVTGAFHEDGLADIADAFGGGWTAEERLEILKDSRHGTYGVAALTSSVVVRVVALGAVSDPAVMLAGAVMAHVLGRAAAVAAMASVPPAVESGLGAGAARGMGTLPFVVGTGSGLVLSVLVGGWWAGPTAVAAALAVPVVGRLAVTKIGGITGDVLGAVEQVAECAVLVTVAALAADGGVPYWR